MKPKMKLAYYRNAEGAITNISRIPKEWTEDDLAARVLEFNSKHKAAGVTAYIAEIEPDSLEEYILNRLEQVGRVAKDLKEDALEAIRNAESCIESLEVTE